MGGGNMAFTEAQITEFRKQGFQIEGTDLIQYTGQERIVTIPPGVTCIRCTAFFDCSSIQSVTIPDTVTSIDSGAFTKCHSPVWIVIPRSVTSIRNHVFLNCGQLQLIFILGNEITIDNGAFKNCSKNAMSIIMLGSVNSIGFDAFSGNSAINLIAVPDTLELIHPTFFELSHNIEHVFCSENMLGRLKERQYRVFDNAERCDFDSLKRVFENSAATSKTMTFHSKTGSHTYLDPRSVNRLLKTKHSAELGPSIANAKKILRRCIPNESIKFMKNTVAVMLLVGERVRNLNNEQATSKEGKNAILPTLSIEMLLYILFYTYSSQCEHKPEIGVQSLIKMFNTNPSNIQAIDHALETGGGAKASGPE